MLLVNSTSLLAIELRSSTIFNILAGDFSYNLALSSKNELIALDTDNPSLMYAVMSEGLTHFVTPIAHPIQLYVA